jgi:hypothetical protein
VLIDKNYKELQAKYQLAGKVLGDHQREGIQANFLFAEKFWSKQKHARLIDAELVRFCFGGAASEVLGVLHARGGRMQLARCLAQLGIYLITWFKLGKDTFLGARRGMPVESQNMQTMLDYQASIGKIETERGLVLFVSKQIPCSCLDESKENAKQAPKTGRCRHCNSEDLKLELKKCSQCKSVQYCSKECQVAAWRAGHKKEC